MHQRLAVSFDPVLTARYDRPGPRYTSYPTAVQFSSRFGASDYAEAVARSRTGDPGLSVYVHVPFCTSPCFYCACTRIITRQREVAVAYQRRLEREIALQGELFGGGREVRQLHFGGGTPTYFETAQLAQVMSALDRHFGLSEDESREYSIEVDPRTVHVGSPAELAGLGFNRLSLGVQDFDPAVQRAVNRVQSVRDTADIVDAARAAGFRSVSVDLIYGLPLQTPTSFRRTLDRVLTMRPDRVSAYSYAHLPRQFKAQRVIDRHQLPTPQAKIELLHDTVEALTAAGYVYIGMDHFALPDDELAVALRRGSLHRNFQGYSTRGGLDLVGLGLSAIGKVADTYSQNAKTLNGYYGALDENRLPVERGIVLGPDDRVRRDVIADIMCRGRVEFAEIEARHGVVFEDYFADSLEKLEPLAADGLVELGAGEFRVTSRGRLLVRPVAMAFDACLQNRDSEPRYSKVI